MGIRDWLSRLLKSESPDTVPFYDFETRSVVRIPRRELSPGAIQAQIQGMDEVVWVLSGQLKQGPLQHEPFDEQIRDYLRRIQSAFAEHRDLSLDEWEDGFRRDAHAGREIALWSHAADTYLQFTADEQSADRRRDVYLCIVTCMTTSPDSVWSVLEPQRLDKSDAQRVINHFYRADA